jgi:Domain of unknown function (DUF4307)
MQERYGTRSPRRRRIAIVATTVLAAVFLGWLLWAAFFNDTAVDAEVASFRVVDDHQIQVKLQMRLKHGHTGGSCTFGATGRDHSPVGEQTFTVAQIQAAQGGWMSIQTLSRATTVQKTSCTDH